MSVSAYRHGPDVQGLRRVHLAELPKGFGPAAPTDALLVLPFPVLDQTPTNCPERRRRKQSRKSRRPRKKYSIQSICAAHPSDYLNKVGNVLVPTVYRGGSYMCNIFRTQRLPKLYSCWSIENTCIKPCFFLSGPSLLDRRCPLPLNQVILVPPVWVRSRLGVWEGGGRRRSEQAPDCDSRDAQSEPDRVQRAAPVRSATGPPCSPARSRRPPPQLAMSCPAFYVEQANFTSVSPPPMRRC